MLNYASAAILCCISCPKGGNIISVKEQKTETKNKHYTTVCACIFMLKCFCNKSSCYCLTQSTVCFICSHFGCIACCSLSQNSLATPPRQHQPMSYKHSIGTTLLIELSLVIMNHQFCSVFCKSFMLLGLG